MRNKHLNQAVCVYAWYRLKQQHALGRGRGDDPAKARVIDELSTVLMEMEPQRNREQLLNELDNLVNDVRHFGPLPMEDWRWLPAILLFPTALVALSFITEASLSALLMAASLFATTLLAFAAGLWLLYRPYLSAMKHVCRQDGYGLQLLQGLCDLQQEPLGQVIRRYCLPQLAAYGTIALLLATSVAAVNGVRKANEDAYHAEMSAIAISAKCAGTRYAVYDADEQRYVDGYLADEFRADTALDVRAVLSLTKETRQIMSSEYSQRYWRVRRIDLIDQRTGVTMLTEVVYGSTPRTPNDPNERHQPRYGNEPDKAEIRAVIDGMIRRYESGNTAE